MEPLKMKPTFKEYIWAGDSLKKKYGKPQDMDKVSESWEVAAHKNGESIASNGIYAGKTLKEIIDIMGAELTGDYVRKNYPDKFPLLVKFLDCGDKLSIQVHPDNEFAGKHENGELGKTEMWYILDAKPDAKLIYGFKRDVTRQEFEDAIKNGDLDNILNYVDVKRGDSFYIPSGTVHALLDGLLVAEIQQNSDTTYRVYDYNRKDKDGNTRPLHIEKSIACADLKASKDSGANREVKILGTTQMSTLAECKYFTAEKYNQVESTCFETTNQTFEILVFCEGNGKIEYENGEIEFVAGDSFVIPAYLGKYKVLGECEFIRSYVPFE